MHVTDPDKTPREQEYVPVPVWAYVGESHVGIQEAPLARLDEHVPKPPFDGAMIVQGLALHVAVSVVSVPALQVLVPETVYPLLQVGVHELPLARLDVHGLATPFVIAPADSADLSFAASQSKA